MATCGTPSSAARRASSPPAEIATSRHPRPNAVAYAASVSSVSPEKDIANTPVSRPQNTGRP